MVYSSQATLYSHAWGHQTLVRKSNVLEGIHWLVGNLRLNFWHACDHNARGPRAAQEMPRPPTTTPYPSHVEQVLGRCSGKAIIYRQETTSLHPAPFRGGSRFSFGVGGAKCYVPARTLRAQNRTHFRQGFRSSRVVLMLSRAFWALFLSILIFFLWIDPPPTVDPILGGRLLPPPPPLDTPLPVPVDCFRTPMDLPAIYLTYQNFKRVNFAEIPWPQYDPVPLLCWLIHMGQWRKSHNSYIVFSLYALNATTCMHHFIIIVKRITGLKVWNTCA